MAHYKAHLPSMPLSFHFLSRIFHSRRFVRSFGVCNYYELCMHGILETSETTRRARGSLTCKKYENKCKFRGMKLKRRTEQPQQKQIMNIKANTMELLMRQSLVSTEDINFERHFTALFLSLLFGTSKSSQMEGK